MPAITPASRPDAQKLPCPHCGKPYRTLVKRDYGIKMEGDIKQSIPVRSLFKRSFYFGASLTHLGT